jgi:hypothetical protein
MKFTKISTPNQLPLVLLIGGVNSGTKSTLWNFEDLGFPGEVRTEPWDSSLDFPEGSERFDPVKLYEAAVRYVQVIKNAEKKGVSIGKELLAAGPPGRKVIVVAHSMGTRCAAALAKYCAERCGIEGVEFPVKQFFLFNGAAPIHDRWNLTDILVKAGSEGHNFFNPLDPVISPLAAFCRTLQIASIAHNPTAHSDLFQGEHPRAYFSPPIGHCPTTIIPYNYNLSPVQKNNHSIKRIKKYISFDECRNVLKIDPEIEKFITTSVPTTFDEVLDNLKKAILQDPAKNPDDYLRVLSEEQREIIKNSIVTLERSENLVISIHSLARQFYPRTQTDDKMRDLIKQFDSALKVNPVVQDLPLIG